MQTKKEKEVSKRDQDTDELDVMSDMRYVCESCSLITEALQQGCDVMQLPSGKIIISKQKIVTFEYQWDSDKGKLVRTQSGNKVKKYKTRKTTSSNQNGKEKKVQEQKISEMTS
jgi:hypothetical protein